MKSLKMTIVFIVGFLIGGPIIIGALHLFWGESPQDAYERGYKLGRAEGEMSINAWYNTRVVEPTDTFYVMTAVYDKDSCLLDISGQRVSGTLDSVKGWLKIRQIYSIPPDPTDTMPAVEPDTGGSL